MLDKGSHELTPTAALDDAEPGDGLLLIREAGESLRAGAQTAFPPTRLPCCSEFEPGADVHHRRTPGVDRADDLLGVDPLEVHAGRGHIRMPELALDHG